ncbi:MAG TPA: folylpolyglutamate synthase/dihydrofolate synthase family protein [Sphingomicrobium sp.]|nr:folylpolyglutamate synthase/dihydrofolate synthase family protein [Sphingomicrobium sp.]
MVDFARSANPAVQAELDLLSKLSPGGDLLGLDRITRLLERLGRPQDSLPPVFHVAGTNGKGSTCAFLRAALEASGHKVHVFTSPHLVRFNERIRIAGRLIEDDLLAALLKEVREASEDIEPSFFEATTAVAFLAFARTPADVAIVEVGLGGRLDATNVIDKPLVCGIAGLGLDHQQFLGRRMIDIADEKAGIARRGVPLVTQLYPDKIATRIGGVATNVSAQWLPRGGIWDAEVRQDRLHYRDEAGELALPLPRLPGRHQALNAALAVAMLRHQDRLKVPVSALNAAMGWADWPARLQRLGRGPLTGLLPTGSELWVDGGHNPAAARLVADHVKHEWRDGRPVHLLFAALESKDADGLLKPFAGVADMVHTLPIADHDCRDPKALADMARKQGFEAHPRESLGQALAAIRKSSRALVFGSLYLAGEALAANGTIPD